MKALFTLLFSISLNAVPLAQTIQQPKLEPKPEQSITPKQVVDLPLPKRGFRPSLTWQNALKLADGYTAKERIDLSPYYLYEAKYILYGSKENRESCWFFWWVNENGTLGDYVEVIVSIKTRNVRRLPSM